MGPCRRLKCRCVGQEEGVNVLACARRAIGVIKKQLARITARPAVPEVDLRPGALHCGKTTTRR